MATAALAKVVDELTSAVDYLRIAIGPPDDGWLECAPLVDDTAQLAAVVASTKGAQGTDRDDVATSLFVQGYVFRVATVAIGSWVLTDRVIDVDPATTAIALGRGRPNAVRLAATTSIVDPGDVEALHDTLIARHLAPLVATAHEACRVGAALLWGNVAASCAAACSAFAAVPRAADRVESFFATARPEVRDAGAVIRVGDRFAWERHSCCLWYHTAGGYLCEDCSLRPAADHQARYEAMARAT